MITRLDGIRHSDRSDGGVECRHSFPQDPQSIENDQYRAAFMPQHSKRQRQIKECCDHEESDHRKCERHILTDSTSCRLTDPDRNRQAPQVVTHQHHIGHLKCDVRSGTSHGNSNLSCRESRCIIHTIANHRNDIAICGKTT